MCVKFTTAPAFMIELVVVVAFSAGWRDVT